MLDFLNIHFEYNNRIILNDFSMRLQVGEVVSLLGPSGCGKTTLLKSIVGLIKINKGKIFINQKLLQSYDNKFSSHQFGVVFQKDALFDSLCVWNNIMFQSLNKDNDKNLILKAKKILKKVGLLPGDAYLFPNELSGGMRKRVAIARAIINDPEIILADEPTGSLDLNTAKEIFKILKNLKKSNRLIIFATHNRFFANKADCLLGMTNGSVKTINVCLYPRGGFRPR